MKELDDARLVAGTVVIEAPGYFTPKQRAALHQTLAAAFQGRRFVVLEGGVKVSTAEQLDRIESKLDRLLAALAEDEQGEPQGFDLEGSPLPQDRDPTEPL